MPFEKIIETKRVTITFDQSEEEIVETTAPVAAPVVSADDAEVIRKHLASLGIKSSEGDDSAQNEAGESSSGDSNNASTLQQLKHDVLECCEYCKYHSWEGETDFEMKERIAAHMAREEYHARREKADPKLAIESTTPEQKARDIELVKYWVGYFRDLWKTSKFDRPRKCQICDDKFTVFEDQLKHYQLFHDCHLICINAHVVKKGSKKKGTYREKKGYMVELLLMGQMYALSNI